MKIPETLYGKQLYDWLIQNKSLLIAAKKAAVKEGDIFSMRSNLFVNEKGEIEKATIAEDATKLNASLIINTTNWYDSHGDVHIPGLWKKSISETKEYYLLKEHVMSFENVISDQVIAVTKKIGWVDLGYNAKGSTEALIFNTIIEKQRHNYMFDQYSKGYIKNHSVGMRYVKLKMAINDEDYKEEFAVWNQYIDDIVNKEDAEMAGFFWAVTEAKVIEGSAVVKGSNRITPVYRIEASKGTEEDQPPQGTGNNQPHTTKDESVEVNWDRIAELIY